ncbi:hypothetical protein CAPTEDRAFT_228430 [Capitella teleta]|uniref:SnoaL-like domain-containing protein n=1 Tax=Capitella teleta TaxID=283909 RepID=R7U628_CAPTE|nr:hypothetical protein CAPTEDRAFT_228430 [Capitella teleta]|eukprot:ELT99151.1 hypothetical protein CAPTEDRAFT_228430 [Capitella teleta]
MADREVAITEIKDRLIQCFELYNKGDMAACTAFYATDAKLFPPGFEPAEGAEAISAGLQFSYNSNNVKHLDYEIKEVQVAGPEVGYSCAATVAKDANGEEKGKFQDLMLWTKMSGEWLVFREMFNQRP